MHASLLPLPHGSALLVDFSLPEFMAFRLYGKAFAVTTKKSGFFFERSTQEVGCSSLTLQVEGNLALVRIPC